MPDNRHLITSFAAGESSLSSTEQATVSLYSFDSSGGTIRRITAGTTEEYYPSVAPNGSNIAFSLVLQDSDLLEVSVEGSEVRPLLATARNEREPAWARSGTQYAYVTDAHGPVEIWLRNPVEGSARALIRDTDIQGESAFRVGLSSPQFSPDGLRIAYLGRGKVWVSPVAGGQPVAVDAPQGLVSASSPVWSPDGNWIVYIRGFGPRWVIAKTPSGGGGPASELASGVGPAGLDCSPTGEWLCYRRADGLHLMTLDGKQDHMLSRTTPVVFGFSKDGAKIYAIRRGARRTWERVIIDVRTGAESNVAELNLPPSATLRGFSLHPDGKRFATTIGTTRSDIWILGGFTLPRRGFAALWPIKR
jgi:Tol biopolymer transport system component